MSVAHPRLDPGALRRQIGLEPLQGRRLARPADHAQQAVGMFDPQGQGHDVGAARRQQHDRSRQHGQRVRAGQHPHDGREGAAGKGNLHPGQAEALQGALDIPVKRAFPRRGDPAIAGQFVGGDGPGPGQRMPGAAGDDVAARKQRREIQVVRPLVLPQRHHGKVQPAIAKLRQQRLAVAIALLDHDLRVLDLKLADQPGDHPVHEDRRPADGQPPQPAAAGVADHRIGLAVQLVDARAKDREALAQFSGAQGGDVTFKNKVLGVMVRSLDDSSKGNCNKIIDLSQ